MGSYIEKLFEEDNKINAHVRKSETKQQLIHQARQERTVRLRDNFKPKLKIAMNLGNSERKKINYSEFSHLNKYLTFQCLPAKEIEKIWIENLILIDEQRKKFD